MHVDCGILPPSSSLPGFFQVKHGLVAPDDAHDNSGLRILVAPFTSRQISRCECTGMKYNRAALSLLEQASFRNHVCVLNHSSIPRSSGITEGKPVSEDSGKEQVPDKNETHETKTVGTIEIKKKGTEFPGPLPPLKRKCLSGVFCLLLVPTNLKYAVSPDTFQKNN
jgi:hypothetical protein